ncbi:MAG: hypothetical protein LBQ64_04185, partial [Bacteroidales bacterium]|nr:hypothetical protein [Bacteroidales bacterium]
MTAWVFASAGNFQFSIFNSQLIYVTFAKNQITDMEFALKEGIKGYKEQRVTLEDTAKSYGSGSMEVFATPAMIALMEQTAYNSVMSLLPEEWTTVGTE